MKYLMNVVIEAQEAFNQSATALEAVNKTRTELRENRDGAAVLRTAAFVVMVYERQLAGKQNKVVTGKFQAKTSKGTLKWTSAFASRFVTLNPDCACTVSDEKAQKASLKNMLETFNKLNLRTKSDFIEYGVPVYQVSDLSIALATTWADTAIGKDGPLVTDQKDAIMADLINVLAKHEKKNA